MADLTIRLVQENIDLGKVMHKAKMISPTGGVSPLCAKTPRRINLKKAGWTMQWKFVTCRKCLEAKTHKARPGKPKTAPARRFKGE